MALLPGLCCQRAAGCYTGVPRLHVAAPEGNRCGKSAAMPGSCFGGWAAADAAGPPGPTGL